MPAASSMSEPAEKSNLTALVLFSGGQDSTTCLADALQGYRRVETLGFDYGQRHRVELLQRAIVLERLRDLFPQWACKLGVDHLLDASVLNQIGHCALTDERAFALQADGLPNTFVPGRNLLFLTLAAALAYRRDLDEIVIGVCETDYSGYPDCRHEAMAAMERALNAGLDRTAPIRTPLMWLTKAQTWALAQSLGGESLVQLIVEHTHTCYLGQRNARHPWGYGCGQCDACRLRSRGWKVFIGDAQD